jgi:hypothetical protein
MTNTGLLGYYGLLEWWNEALSGNERERIESVFHPMGDSRPRPLTEGSIYQISGDTATPVSLLSNLVGWLRATPEDLVIRQKLRRKIVELVDSEPGAIARHFALQVLIGEFYRDRESEPSALNAAIDACRAQIAIAPEVAAAMRGSDRNSPLPRHVGYEQLAIILEKAKEYTAAMAVCREAKAAGWNSDWDKRIARCQKRLEKS